MLNRVAAWCVHAFTAMGAVVGFWAIIEIARGHWVASLVLMGVTIAIDSLDGTLARKARVKEVLPQFHGDLLDNIVDYFTYVIVPAYFLFMAGLVPYGFAFVSAGAITFASCYQFAQSDAKTDDHFFLGFPSYWNIVVFYLYMLEWPAPVNLAIVLLLTIGVFVPIKYLYPSRTRPLFKTTATLSVIWGILAILALVTYPEFHKPYIYASLVYVIYYFAVSFYFTLSVREVKQHGSDNSSERA